MAFSMWSQINDKSVFKHGRMPLGKILLNDDVEDNKLGMEDSGEYEDFPQVNFKTRNEFI